MRWRCRPGRHLSVSSRRDSCAWIPAHPVLSLCVCVCAALPRPHPSNICCCARSSPRKRLGLTSQAQHAPGTQRMTRSDLQGRGCPCSPPLGISRPCGDLGLQQACRALRDWVAQSAGRGWRECNSQPGACAAAYRVAFSSPNLPSISMS